MTDFIPILVAAILSLIILVIMFAGEIVFFSPAVKTGERVILLGEGFEVFYDIGEEIVADEEGVVTNGIFSGNHDQIAFEVGRHTEATEATVDLYIFDSNYYGNMILNLNGEEVFRGAHIGDKMMPIDPEILEKDNILSVSAEGSTWRIWAPTVYEYSINMDVVYEGKKIKSFEFDMNEDEVSNIKHARIVIVGKRTGYGELLVYINGEEAASDYVAMQKNFPTDILKVGENKVEIMAEADTSYDIDFAKIFLFF